MQFVRITDGRTREIEIPSEEDRTLKLKDLETFFPGVKTLIYKFYGRTRVVKVSNDILHPPYNNWGNTVYKCIFPKADLKRKRNKRKRMNRWNKKTTSQSQSSESPPVNGNASNTEASNIWEKPVEEWSAEQLSVSVIMHSLVSDPLIFEDRILGTIQMGLLGNYNIIKNQNLDPIEEGMMMVKLAHLVSWTSSLRTDKNPQVMKKIEDFLEKNPCFDLETIYKFRISLGYRSS